MADGIERVTGPGYELIRGDCLDVLPGMGAGSCDAVICDPPYGTTACAWDSVIPFAPMWAAIKHVVKPRAAVVMFGSQPFTSALVMSNPGWFRYETIWRKVRVTGHLDANRKPLREHENICVFCDGQTIYNPQMTPSKGHVRGPFGHRKGAAQVYNDFIDDYCRANYANEYYPRSMIEFLSPMQSIHPTQKPVDLLAYLIRTYTNPGDTVLDFTMGSGTTGVAALQTGRKFIGIELDVGYFTVAARRIADAARAAAGQPKQLSGHADDWSESPLFAGVGGMDVGGSIAH